MIMSKIEDWVFVLIQFNEIPEYSVFDWTLFSIDHEPYWCGNFQWEVVYIIHKEIDSFFSIGHLAYDKLQFETLIFGKFLYIHLGRTHAQRLQLKFSRLYRMFDRGTDKIVCVFVGLIVTFYSH